MKVPESFSIHRKLRKPLMKRLEILDEGPIEYGHAESLAFAWLLTEGTHIRLTGRDPEHGTFSHRHLILHDEETGLDRADPGPVGPSRRWNSPTARSEMAYLGSSTAARRPRRRSLILWEAQFGDFADSAQVIIDSFIAAGEWKWGRPTR